jgi:UTP:GlnB (protein PII) uridylyltransferase
MSQITLSDPLASQLRREAESYGLAVEQLVEAAVRHYRFQAQREKISAESAWWEALAPEKRARYDGEYVAVHLHEVVDHDKSEDTLRKRIRAKYGKTAVLITPSQGRRELRIVNTRLASL